MKILHITPSYKPAYIYGGAVTISSLAESQAKLGHSVTVYTTTANGKSELDVAAGTRLNVDGVSVYYFTRVLVDRTGISLRLWRFLHQTINNFDIVHIHSWWNLLVMGALLISKGKNVRPILSPHGMFSDYIATTRNKYKKKIIQKLLGNKLLKAVALHSTTELERKECEQFVPRSEITTIYNIVKFPEKEYARQRNEVFTIGFISRIHEVKGLDLLIKALSKVSFPYALLIAGDGEKSYIDYLKALSAECGNDDKINWVGWKDGEEKFNFLSQVDVFALTSHNENFALVVIEALSVGTPVLISKHVGLHDYVANHKLGTVCNLKVENIIQNLNAIFENGDQLDSWHKNVANTVRNDFDELNLAAKYVQFYDRIIQTPSRDAISSI